MRDIWLPDFVYKYLPLLCMIIGFSVAPFISKLALPLCVGLVAYGISIYSMRHSWRNSDA